MKVGEVEGIAVVLKAMDTHINNADVCFYGCGALWNITDDNCYPFLD